MKSGEKRPIIGSDGKKSKQPCSEEANDQPHPNRETSLCSSQCSFVVSVGDLPSSRKPPFSGSHPFLHRLTPYFSSIVLTLPLSGGKSRFSSTFPLFSSNILLCCRFHIDRAMYLYYFVCLPACNLKLRLHEPLHDILQYQFAHSGGDKKYLMAL